MTQKNLEKFGNKITMNQSSYIKSELAKEKIAMITMDVEIPDVYTKKSMDTFLEILKEFNIKATFFVTYGIAKRFPDIIRHLVEKGHEVASHGCSDPNTLEDINLLKYTRTEIQDEIEKSKLFLKNLEVEPQGIRLPGFTWNMQILNTISRYFKYDSSVAPEFFRKNSDLCNFNPTNLINGKLIELPISRINWLNLRLGTPVFLKMGAKKLIKLIKMFGVCNPLLFYCHSFDLVDIDINKLTSKNWKKKWYYEQCGPSKMNFFRIFFEYLKEEKFNIVRCIDFVNMMLSEKNKYV